MKPDDFFLCKLRHFAMGHRVLFFCGHHSRYGIAHLEPLLQSSFDIIGVVLADQNRWQQFAEILQGKKYWKTASDSVSLSRKTKNIINNFRHPRKKINVDKICRQNKLPIWRVNDVNTPSFIEEISKLEVDFIFSAAYPQIFSRELISVPRLNSVNFHPSLLPKFRGAHPHYWSIAKGAIETGITAHYMTEELDAGDIIEQVSFPINGVSLKQLYDKLVESTPLLVSRVESFFNTDAKAPSPQKSSDATYFRSDREIHNRIFWDIHSTEEIENLVRTGMAYCFFRNEYIHIGDVYVTETNRNLTNDIRVPPGVVVDILEDALVVTGIDGCVNIKKLANSQRNYTFYKWASHKNIRIGERFV